MLEEISQISLSDPVLPANNETKLKSLSQKLYQNLRATLRVHITHRNWPEGRGIFHNDAKTFLTWVNEEDQLRIISMEQGSDIGGVFSRLARAANAIE